ncbi:hypothetical protein [Mucilaginibacter sp.]
MSEDFYDSLRMNIENQFGVKLNGTTSSNFRYNREDVEAAKIAYQVRIAPYYEMEAKLAEMRSPDPIQIVESKWLDNKRYKQKYFPKSKKKRIRQKWAKNKKHWGMVYVPTVYLLGNKLIVDSKVYARLKQRMAKDDNSIDWLVKLTQIPKAP